MTGGLFSPLVVDEYENDEQDDGEQSVATFLVEAKL